MPRNGRMVLFRGGGNGNNRSLNVRNNNGPRKINYKKLIGVIITLLGVVIFSRYAYAQVEYISKLQGASNGNMLKQVAEGMKIASTALVVAYTQMYRLVKLIGSLVPGLANNTKVAVGSAMVAGMGPVIGRSLVKKRFNGGFENIFRAGTVYAGAQYLVNPDAVLPVIKDAIDLIKTTLKIELRNITTINYPKLVQNLRTTHSILSSSGTAVSINPNTYLIPIRQMHNTILTYVSNMILRCANIVYTGGSGYALRLAFEGAGYRLSDIPKLLLTNGRNGNRNGNGSRRPRSAVARLTAAVRGRRDPGYGNGTNGVPRRPRTAYH